MKFTRIFFERIIVVFLMLLLTCTAVDARRKSRSHTRSHHTSASSKSSRSKSRQVKSSHSRGSRHSYRSHRAAKRTRRSRSFRSGEVYSVTKLEITPGEYRDMLLLADPDSANDAEAQYMLGNYFYQQMVPDVPEDTAFVNAVRFWALATANKHPRATGNLAYSYRTGVGVEPDTARAKSLYIQSLELGNPPLLDMIRRSADFGEPFDAWIMYECYKDGRGGLGRNDTLALEYLEDLSEYGEEDATRLLGDYYYERHMIDSAMHYYSFLENPSENVIYMLAGMGASSDPAALLKLESLASSGHRQSVEAMAEIYTTGYFKGRKVTAPDVSKAAVWNRKAAAMGSHTAGMEIASDLILGDGVKPDYDRAIYFLENAIPGGHSREYLNSLSNKWASTSFPDYVMAVALMYDGQYAAARHYFNLVKGSKDSRNVPGIDVRIAEANMLSGVETPSDVFKHLSEQVWSNSSKKDKRKLKKNVKSQALTMLSRMLDMGQGTPVDKAEAERWAVEASAMGDAGAMSIAGNLAFERGDYATATQRYQQALDDTGVLYPEARRNYIKCLRDGLGVKRDDAYAEVLRRAVPSNTVINLYYTTLTRLRPVAPQEQPADSTVSPSSPSSSRGAQMKPDLGD